MGLVVIGRNEGERLKRCLRSIPSGYQVVYVDSGSTDGSVAFAQSTGAAVVELDMRSGFTAAKARNAGWRWLLERDPALEFVQFVDGDCEVTGEWLGAALAAIEAEANLAVVFGRRRERFPERTIYNRMCEDEWNVPIGLVDACGGDALVRTGVLRELGGYSEDLIAGEEPDLCLRAGRLGWRVRRIDAEMTLHDANILSFGSWWKRAKRAGYAYAEHVRRHGSSAIPQWRRALMSIVFWGMALPVGTLVLAAVTAPFAPLVAALILASSLTIYALQFLRIAWRKQRSGHDWRFAGVYAGLLMLGKFAEASGTLKCWLANLEGRRHELIEYK
jgi:glycosyltransferase involved in cell wall biosynthesis